MTSKLRSLNLPVALLVLLNQIPSLSLRPRWFNGLALILILYRIWLELTNRAMPPRWVLFGLQAVIGLTVWQHYRSLFGDEAAGTWLALLAVMKLFELRERRDYFIAVLLCFLVLMSVLLLDQSLLLSLFLILDGVLIMGMLYAVEEGGWAWTEWRGTFKRSLGLLLRVVPVLALLFVLFPRFSTGFGTDRSGQGKTGISDRLRPGAVSKLIQSDELVFRATFLNGEVPPLRTLYWRGAVLDRSMGLSWDRSDQASALKPPVANEKQNEIEVYLEPGFEKFLFSLENTAAIFLPSDLSRNRLMMRDGGIFELNHELQAREHYFLESGPSHVGAGPGPQDLAVDPPSPEVSAFLKPYARLGNAEKVARLLEHFRRNGFSYTLQPPEAASVDDFLFRSKSGFCEHFAGSMATLLRQMNVPARVVVGFQGGAPSFLENFITVRAHDAHAWIEYYDPDASRWRRADPTATVAPARFDSGSTSYLFREQVPGWFPTKWQATYFKTRALVDEIEARWIGFLVRFDLARQKELLAKLGMEAVLFRALPVFLVMALALVLAVLYYFEARGREPLSKEEVLYRKLLSALERLKVSKADNEGPLTLLNRIESTDPTLALRSVPILTALLESRYGSRKLSPTDAARLNREIRALVRPWRS